jgi:dipeptidyl aminopeptidase/acylaminoacyl peptidase
MPRSARLLPLVLGLAILGGGLVGCSSPSQAPSASPDTTAAAPSGPAFAFLYTTAADGLVLHDARADTSRTLVPGATHDGPAAVSPRRRRLAFTYTTGDSTHLALLDRSTGALRTVDARPAAATYSLAWHPEDDTLAFGYYRPSDEGTRGPGAIFVVPPDGPPRDVGCRAAREVLAWLPDGALATRTDDTLYLVAPSDCATRASADARRLRNAAYAPTGTRLAYIHRELTYDRDRRAYTPDSSLVLSDARGENATPLLDPDRRVRHLRWAPDASELAFDVRVEASGHRQVAAYNVGRERTVYLTPPAQTRADQRFPRWSPSSSYVAFTSGTGPDATATLRVEGQTRRLGPVDGAVWGWLDDQTLVIPGPDRLRVQTLDNTTRYALPAPAALVHAWRPDRPL